MYWVTACSVKARSTMLSGMKWVYCTSLMVSMAMLSALSQRVSLRVRKSKDGQMESSENAIISLF